MKELFTVSFIRYWLDKGPCELLSINLTMKLYVPLSVALGANTNVSLLSTTKLGNYYELYYVVSNDVTVSPSSSVYYGKL